MARVEAGGSAALHRFGLPLRCFACWGRWMSEWVAAHYDDAPDEFVLADNVNCRGLVHMGHGRWRGSGELYQHT